VLPTASHKTSKVGATHTILVCNNPTSYISIKVKITGKVFPAHVSKEYSGTGGEIQFHSFLTLALD